MISKLQMVITDLTSSGAWGTVGQFGNLQARNIGLSFSDLGIALGVIPIAGAIFGPLTGNEQRIRPLKRLPTHNIHPCPNPLSYDILMIYRFYR